MWGIAQTGQNVVPSTTRRSCARLGFNPNDAADVRGVRPAPRPLRAKLPTSEPVIEFGNKEGYGTIHFFGGIQGAYVKAQPVRNWIYHVPGSRYETPGTIKALRKLQQWGKAGYFNYDYNAVGYDDSATEFAKGKGVFWIGGDWDSTIIKTGLGAKNVGVIPIPPGPGGRGRRSAAVRPVAHLGEDEVPGPRRGVAQLRDHVPARQDADVLAAADPGRPGAKAPAGDPFLAQVSKAFQLVADDDGLLLYTDWASPSMYTTLQNQFQLLLAGRQTPAGMAKAVQADWAKFDKTLR